MSIMERAVIVVGHGSKSAEAVSNFESVVAMASHNLGQVLYGAHMELAHPCIEDVVSELWGKGVKNFVVVPYFLYHGMHIEHDIPGILEDMKSRFPGISYTLGQPIGEDPLMGEILARRIAQASGGA
jgi:sirohydrochlorin ferrochelatase